MRRNDNRLWWISFGVWMLAMSSAHAGVNPNGGFSTAIPILMPAGAGGVTPSVSMAYGGGNIAGQGWGIEGLPMVTRMSYGRGINYDGNDTYVGPSGRMVDVSTTGTNYHGERTDWIKYTPTGPGCAATCGDGPCCWTAELPGGGKMYFGTTADSRIEKVSSTSVRIWALSKVENVHGNYYEVAYTEYAAKGAYYPATITYTKGNNLNTFRTVNFIYESRPDVSTGYASGKMTVDLRLKEISIKSNNVLVRKYGLVYTTSPRNGASLLSSVTEYGSDGVSTLPAQTFTYLNGTANTFGNTGFTNDFFDDAHGMNLPENYSTIGTPDVNGDGLPDVCARRGEGVRCVINQANNSFGPESLWTSDFSTSQGWSLNELKTVRYADVNADGKDDICARDEGGYWCAMSSGTNFGGRQLWNGWVSDANSDYEFASLYETLTLVDVNSDALVDLCGRTRNGVQCWSNTGSNFLGATLNDSWFKDANGFDDVNNASAMRYLDVDGDGWTDICARRESGGMWCGLHNRTTGWAGATQWTTGTALDVGWNQDKYRKTIQFTDLNGDGLPDICGRQVNQIYCYINNGTSFVVSAPRHG